uniref:Uncharacterized protein n=1 Tax=Callorhinchus milii TaxID=7868 RepID=A0A4W3HZ04_CALMI
PATPGSSGSSQLGSSKAPSTDPLGNRTLGLKTPLAVQGPFPVPFGMVHSSVNGGMAGAGAYAGLHYASAQLNGATSATAYGRSGVVSVSAPPPLSVPPSCSGFVL